MPETPRASLLKDLQRVVEGEVTQAPEVLERYSQDFGRIVQRTPAAVVLPRHAEDVAQVVRYAHAQSIPVSSRAIGHSMRGQTLNEHGIVIDMRELRRIEPITPDAQTFVSQPGALWREVAEASTAQGLAPPVLTGYPYTSVGGTHSACGWGISSSRYGAQIDNCVELEVVTGTGERVRCSRDQEPDLFNHVLGGMGQFGLMTEVRHRLRRYQPIVRTYVLEYDDLTAYIEDNRTLGAGEVADYLDCALHQKPDGQGIRWTGTIRASVETTDPSRIDDQRLLAGLRFNRHVSTLDEPTSTFLMQDSTPVKNPLPGEAYPWMVTFLPWSRFQPFLEMCFRRVPPTALGGTHGPIHVWPALRKVARIPTLQLPQEEMMALISICPTAASSSLPIMMAVMSKLSDASMEAGGRRHLGTWVHFDQVRWKMHFGDAWTTVNRIKRTYDPLGILNPGFIEFELGAAPSP